MIRQFNITSCFVLACFLIFQTTQAQDKFDTHYLQITIDNQYEDWEIVPDKFYGNVVNPDEPEIENESDFSAFVKIAWDENYLYVLYEATDNEFYTEEPVDKPWLVDGIAIGIDGDTLGNINFFWEPHLDSTYSKYYMPIGHTAEEVLQNEWSLNQSMHDMGSQNEFFFKYESELTSSGYRLEVRFPWTGIYNKKARNTGFGNDDVIRMCFQMNELDGGQRSTVLVGAQNFTPIYNAVNTNPENWHHFTLKPEIVTADIMSDDALLKNQLSVQCYPNPVNDKLRIKSNEFIRSINVFDGRANQVITEKSNGKTHQIDLSGFPNGLYFIQINHQKIYKIIKN